MFCVFRGQKGALGWTTEHTDYTEKRNEVRASRVFLQGHAWVDQEYTKKIKGFRVFCVFRGQKGALGWTTQHTDYTERGNEVRASRVLLQGHAWVDQEYTEK